MPGGECYAAFDLGAESGRLVLGTLDNGRLELREMQRFANRPVRVRDSLHWDVLRLWQDMKDALARVAAERGSGLAGIGLDTWGVDFALLDQHGALLGLPHHYRDGRTEGIQEELARRVSEWELYARTGIAFAPLNTLSQLMALRRQGSPALDVAHSLLMMPSLFNYWLSGRQANEATIAGTTQCYDLYKQDWWRDLLEHLDLPPALPTEAVPTATVLGPLLPSVAQEVGLSSAPVIATACHDTPAAASVVPSRKEHATFISSGTWSVVGTELTSPQISARALAQGFLNEVGACGRTILVRNIMGLWPLQECRREWLRQGSDWSYADLVAMATQARPFTAIVNPDDPSFFHPGDMVAKVAGFCERSGQPSPTTIAEFTRVLLEGLALRYRQTLADLEALTGWPTQTLHILGGGSRNALLCQMTADATQRPVVAGPAEATATATVLLQALARGRLSSLAEMREVVMRSYELARYEPQASTAWDEAYARFLALA